MTHNKKNILFHIICLALGLLTISACLQKEEPERNEIRLKGSLIPTYILKKGVDVQNPGYSEDMIIGMARIDQKETPGYPSFANATKQLRAKMAKGNQNSNLLDIYFLDEYQQFNNETDYIRYASWHPYSPDSFHATEHSISHQIDGKTDFLYGSVATGNQKHGFNTIYFDHALCKLTFHVYTQETQDLTHEAINESWGKIKDIQLFGLAKTCKLTLPQTEEDIYQIQYLDESAGNLFSISKSQPDGDLLDAIPVGIANARKLPSLIIAPPSDNQLKIQVLTNNGKSGNLASSKTLTIARNFKRGNNYDIYLRFSDHGQINAEISVAEWMPGKDIEEKDTDNIVYYDLSATEHANCYIVDSANHYYCFDVTSIGNGPAGEIAHFSPDINPGYIDIIWMTHGLEKYFELKSNEPVQGRALFHIKNMQTGTNSHDKRLSQKGNVLIGAYDQSPSSGGKLLWTWLIWLTDRPGIQAYQNGFVVMDRNLGATSAHVTEKGKAAEMDGLYFQWGRPTPLPLGTTVYTPVRSSEEGFYDMIPFQIKDSPEPDNMQLRISHPEKFYTEASAIQSSPEFVRFWGFHPKTFEYEKTILDPCPPGYRIPSKSMFKHIEYLKIELNKDHGHSYQSTADSYYELDNALTGYYINAKNRIGYYMGEEQTVPDQAGAYLWSGSLNFLKKPRPNVWSPFSLDCLLQNDKTPSDEKIEERQPTCALPVRCVSKRSIHEIKNLSEYQTANSYIISQTGIYKFRADIRGNGIAQLTAPGSGKSIDISENLTPDISEKAYQLVPLWWQGDLSSTDGNDNPNHNPVPISFIQDGLVHSDGYVYFSVTSPRKGNLIVGVKDQLGNLLWSWHIWLTEKPRIHNSYDYAVMDRFLGATTIPTNDPTEKEYLGSLGFYYEWGRKDPFPGPNRKNGTDYSIWWKYDEDNQTWIQMNGLESTTNQPAQKTVRNSVEHPMRYHLSQDDLFKGKDVPRNFTLEDYENRMENQCFSNTANQASMWGYSSMAGSLGKTSTKTMYDPCPPGYSVAYYLIWTYADIAQRDPIYTYKDAGNVNATKYSSYNDFGIFLERTGFSRTWYPYTGYIDSSDGKFREVGKIGRFHSSTPAGFGSRSLCYWPENNVLSFYNTTIYTSQTVNNKSYWGIPSTYAYPVRCQKD